MLTSNFTSKRLARGAAMVEMVIIMILLIIIVVGIIDLGRALFFQHKLTKAAESSARYLGRSWDAVDTSACVEGAEWDLAVVRAANLAVFGNVQGEGAPAVINFDVNDVEASVEPREVDTVGTVCVVRIDIAVEYTGFFWGRGGFLPPIILGGDPGGNWTLRAASEERYVGD